MRFVMSVALVLAVAARLQAGEAVGRLVASKEPGWPQWRGPRRDGICDEKGLLQEWPEGGPKLLWTATGLGKGYSSPIITGGTIYITGDVGDQLHVFALDLDGKLKWTGENGHSWKRSYPGARSSCVFDDGRLYHYNAHGRLACLDPADGHELWAVDVRQRFQGKGLVWGLSEAPLVDGPRVVVAAGGRKALVVAFDKKSGEVAWASEPLLFERTEKFGGGRLPQPVQDFDGPGYASAILFELGGRRHIVGCSTRHVYDVDADTGKLLWSRPMPTQWEVLATMPVLCGDAVFVTGPDGPGGKLFRIVVEGGNVRAEEVWTTDMDTCQGGVVLVGGGGLRQAAGEARAELRAPVPPGTGVLYGSWYRRYGSRGCWGAVDAATGKTLYQMKDIVKGSVLWADGRLYCLAESGVMALLRPTAHGFEFAGRFSLTEKRRNDAWAHPVVLGRRMYLRYHDKLACFDVTAK